MSDSLAHRARWMPPAATFRFVVDALDQFSDVGVFARPIDPYNLPEHWIPLIIAGTLEWIGVSGWWPWLYTGVFDTNEAYKWIFQYRGSYEFNPDQFLVFREQPGKNAYTARINQPGIEDRERSEILQFLWRDVFDRFEKSRPPQDILEPVVWATLMWVLSEFGRDWLGQEPIFNSVYTHGVGYFSRHDNQVLDPNDVTCTRRSIGSCGNCGEKLWCVSGFSIDKGWRYLCNACIVSAQAEGHDVDRWDKRVQTPMCGKETCLYVACPHNPTTKESIVESMVAQGRLRVEEYRQQVLSGQQVGLLGGQSADDIVEYFGRR